MSSESFQHIAEFFMTDYSIRSQLFYDFTLITDPAFVPRREPSGVANFRGMTGGIGVHELLYFWPHTTGRTVFPYPSGFQLLRILLSAVYAHLFTKVHDFLIAFVSKMLLIL